MGLDRIPVVDVTKDNINTILPSILFAIKHGTYLGIDCELSGLGNRKKINDSCIEDRYKFGSLVAKTRSLVALGLCVFNIPEDETNEKVNASVFNISLLCAEDYIVEPESLKFLVNHGFDFNKQYSCGIPYSRGDDKTTDYLNGAVRFLFEEIVRSGISVVFHNGFLDLVFLYENLYACLPVELQCFVADISQMFSGGIYDTKYISEYVVRTKASFLSYVFTKYALENKEKGFFQDINFPSYLDQDDVILDLSSSPTNLSLCDMYSNYGHCPKGNSCDRSHDVVAIVKYKQSTSNGTIQERPKKRKVVDKPSIGHRAGFDAFMTVYTLLSVLSSIKKDEVVNKVHLVAKEVPLLVKKSSFSKISKSHNKKFERLKSQTKSDS